LQRLLGYCLTGLTTEHVMAFLYGTGSNGKSVLLNTVSGILDTYHRTAPIETFTASNNERHPTELAGLHGARMVTSIETEEGRRWAESKIKALTGGDKIAARFMRQDFFHYTPQFKLLIAGNHKPSLRTVDEAMRRRFNLVPFTVTIPAEKRDKELPVKLQKEWPGILRWMIVGCLEWQRIGLSPPEAVTKATAEYLTSEDSIAAWLDDCAELAPESFTQNADLFKSWADWATKTGEHFRSQRGFSQKLIDRGFRKDKVRHQRGFFGIRLSSLYGEGL
jgi:putative DNA primase/helicase